MSNRAYHTVPDRNSFEFLSWLNIHELLSEYQSWQEYSANVINYLWSLRDEDGLWNLDSGSRILSGLKNYDMYQLSSNWRNKQNIRIDFSIKVLSVLRKFCDNKARN